MFAATNRVSGASHWRCNSFQEAMNRFRAAERDGLVEKR